MRYRSAHELEKWLAKEIHDRQIPRKPPGKARRGPARDAEYRAWIRTLPSVISGLYGCECAHTGSDGGMSQKASDYSTIPLTQEEHREYHQIGKPEFERRHGIRCAELARALYAEWRARRESAA